MSLAHDIYDRFTDTCFSRSLELGHAVAIVKATKSFCPPQRTPESMYEKWHPSINRKVSRALESWRLSRGPKKNATCENTPRFGIVAEPAKILEDLASSRSVKRMRTPHSVHQCAPAMVSWHRQCRAGSRVPSLYSFKLSRDNWPLLRGRVVRPGVTNKQRNRKHLRNKNQGG